MTEFLTESQIKQLVEKNLDQAIDAKVIADIFSAKMIPELEDADYYQGKVRANFTGGKLYHKNGTPLRVIIATDQISTHDMVRGAIPFRGQILTDISNRMLALTAAHLPNAQRFAPASSMVVIAENCRPFMFEMVWRNYMCKSSTNTSLYYHYVNLNKRDFCGHLLPEGLVANGPLPYMMDTPSTKESEEDAHDVSVSSHELFARGIVTPIEYGQIIYMTGSAYIYGQNYFKKLGIIIPDTKFEIGKTKEGQIVTIDEVLTPDSSRFWLAEDYKEKLAAGKNPTSYSKQFGRDIGTSGTAYTEQERFLIGCRYIETYQKLTGQCFVPDLRPSRQKIGDDVKAGLQRLMLA
jgi:phosphoribosylaminoimidazole-succinocarboxamide synthase